MNTSDTAFLLATCDSFRRHAEAATNPADRERWYGLADRAWRALEAAEAHDGAVLVPVNEAGRTIGQHHHRARLSDADVALIHELREARLSYGEIGAKFDDDARPSRSTIAAICSGRRRCQTVMNHRLVHSSSEPMSWANVDEFEVCT